MGLQAPERPVQPQLGAFQGLGPSEAGELATIAAEAGELATIAAVGLAARVDVVETAHVSGCS